MTEAVEVAVIIGVSTIVASLPTLVVSVKGWRVGKSNHKLANSKLTNVETQLSTALKRIGALEQMLTTVRGRRRRTDPAGSDEQSEREP